MIVQIRVRDDRGKYLSASPGNYAATALHEIIRYGKGYSDGWSFLRDWLCRVCLQMAETYQGNPTVADRWIRRYQAIRGIE